MAANERICNAVVRAPRNCCSTVPETIVEDSGRFGTSSNSLVRRGRVTAPAAPENLTKKLGNAVGA